MNIKDNINDFQNNTITNNKINNKRFATLKTSSNSTNLESNTNKLVENETKDKQKNIIITSHPGITISNRNSTDDIMNHPESKDPILNSSIKNHSFIKELNNLLLEKISDKEFISNIAKNFVNELTNNISAQDIFNESLQKNFVNLPVLIKNGEINKNNRSNDQSRIRRSRSIRESTTSMNKLSCSHKNLPHYAKGLCKNCYHRIGRYKTAINCGHPNRPLYALGLCKQCYQIEYSKNKNSKDIDSDINVNPDEVKSSKELEKEDKDNKSNNLKKSSRLNTKKESDEEKEESSFISTDLKKLQTIFKVNDKDQNNLIININNKFQNIQNNFTTKSKKENPFMIHKSNLLKTNSNNISEIFQIENLINDKEKLSSFTNSNKDRGVNKSLNFINTSEKNDNLNSSSNPINGSNYDNNILFNNINLQSYFNNLLSNNLPYYTNKGTFPNTNLEDFSIIEDFCGNFFPNYCQNFSGNAKSDSDDSNLGKF